MNLTSLGQAGCSHCGSARGYDRTHGRCVACGAPWRVEGIGRPWRTGEPVPADLFRRTGSMRAYALGDAAVWPSDLLAYRQEWEPFIAGHLNLWRRLNSLLESVPAAQQCPAVYTAAAVQSLDRATQQFCAALALTRVRTSATDPGGILPQWNAWANKSSAEILAGASSMLQWHQAVVLRVGGEYKDDLIKITKLWNVDTDAELAAELPAVPSFSAQQSVITRIEGAGLAAQGLLQIIGYTGAQALVGAADTAQAVAQGLSDVAKAGKSALTSPWTWVGIATVVTVVGVAATVVGGALLKHYVPPPELPSPRVARPRPIRRYPR